MGITSVSHGLGRTVWNCGRHKMPRHRQWHDRGRTATAICQPIDATTARGQVVAFALSCQGKFVYAQPSSLRGGPGNPSVGINLDCSSFVQYCYWAQNLLFSAGSTAAYRNAADLVSISPSEVQPGDLRVVYASGGEQGHVQMALGGGAWIECCYGYGVAVNMSNTWMESRPCYYFRYAGF